MIIQKLVSEIEILLKCVHEDTLVWFDKPLELRAYKPQNGGWSIDEILEHITLTNHFLLIIINKGTDKALRNIHNLSIENELNNYTFHRDRLDEVGLHKSFPWMRPEHMEPTGRASHEELKQLLKEQLATCLNSLHLLRNGEGLLYKTTMSVNNLGKIDVYEYIYFLAQHQKRHLIQMQKNEIAFSQIVLT